MFNQAMEKKTQNAVTARVLIPDVMNVKGTVLDHCTMKMRNYAVVEKFRRKNLMKGRQNVLRIVILN